MAICKNCNIEVAAGQACPNCNQPVAQPVQGGTFSLTGLSARQNPPERSTPKHIQQQPVSMQVPNSPEANHNPVRADSTIQPAPINHNLPPASDFSPPKAATPQPQAPAPNPAPPVHQPTTVNQIHVPPAKTVPLTENTSKTPAKIEKPVPVDKRTEEEKALQNEVFTSNLTGYGDDDLEISILAGLLKDPFILENLLAKGLIPGLFSTRFSRAIFKSIVNLRDENPNLSSVDKIVIKNKLKQLNIWDTATQNFLDKIITETPPLLDQALHYLTLLKEQALKRKLKEVAHDISDFIEGEDQPEHLNLETFTNKVIQDVRNIQKARTTKRINLVKEEVREILEDMEQREITGEIDIIGYSFEPMHYLNKALSGFRKGFMYAIAGAPRRGKTTFTLELATRVATLNKIPVLFFTYEQTKKNLTYRLLAKESRLNPDSLQRKKIKSDMIMDAKFMGGYGKMQEYMNHFYIIEATKEETVDRIRSYAYNVMQDFNTEDIMIFVDYLQKMPLSRTYNDEKFKVEEISTELKGLSIELNNPIMTVSSLSKEGCHIDASPDAERPTMYHCKGSGDLEYDLDCAMIQAKDWGDTRELHQQLQHKAEELGKDSTRVPKVDVVNLYLDKNRDAPEGIYSTIQYLFFIEDNKFIELGPKFDDDRFRFSKIEELVDKLIKQNFIIFYDKPKDSSYNKGRVSIKLKNF